MQEPDFLHDTARPAALQMQQGSEVLTKGDRQAILALSTSILWYLCLEKGLPRSKNKKKMTDDLLAWVKNLSHYNHT